MNGILFFRNVYDIIPGSSKMTQLDLLINIGAVPGGWRYKNVQVFRKAKVRLEGDISRFVKSISRHKNSISFYHMTKKLSFHSSSR